MSSVNLVCASQPNQKFTGCSDPQQLIAWIARISNPANQNNHKTAAKLISYLIMHAHWSPFELVHMTLAIETTRDIAKQILRHRSFSFQELSQRYSNPLEILDAFVAREARLQDPKNRQASYEIASEDDEAIKLLEEWEWRQANVFREASDSYRWAIDNGIAKEQSRALLPEGNTKTVVYMSGSLRSWIHYCTLRMKWDTQKEHRIVAEQCWSFVEQIFPDVAAVVKKIEQQTTLKNTMYEMIAKHFIEANDGLTDDEFLTTLQKTINEGRSRGNV